MQEILGAVMIKPTIRKKFDAPYVQAAMLPVIDEAWYLRSPVFFSEGEAHDVEAYLRLAKPGVVTKDFSKTYGKVSGFGLSTLHHRIGARRG
jgi:hypothetical protein